MIVDVYWNLHKKLWSLRDTKTRRVVSHETKLVLQDVQFIVNEKGRQRVLKEQRKNVHAYCRGRWLPTLEDWFMCRIGASLTVTYNPYKYSTFVRRADEKPIEHCSFVCMSRWVPVVGASPVPVVRAFTHFNKPEDNS